MTKKLSEMSNEELWRLFPIIIKPYNPNYKTWYLDEVKTLLNILPKDYIYRINHIGSSAVQNLASKPTVDILLELNKNVSMQEIEKILCDTWILMHSQETPYKTMIFNKGYTPTGFAEKVFHLHVRYKGDWNELYFRDYLIDNQNICTKYAELKYSLENKYKHNRNAYTDAKTNFIKKYTKLAVQIYKNRYTPK